MPPDALDRLLEGVFIELVPIVLDAGADLGAAADVVLALAATSTRTSTRCCRSIGRRPADRGVERAGGAGPRRGRRIRVAGSRLSWRSPGNHRGRTGISQPRRERVVGAGRQCRGWGGLSALASGLERRAGASPDQLPLRRRRRPVHDDREIPCCTPTLGAGGRGRRSARRRGRDHARRHVAADDDAARSVGEHAAHHGRGVRSRNRRCRHGFG